MNLWNEIKSIAKYVSLTIGLMVVALVLNGCTPAEQGGASGMSTPTVELIGGQFVGTIEMADGTVIDAATGLTIDGTGPAAVRRLDLTLTADLSVNGQPQSVEFESRNHRLGEWVSCLVGRLSIMGGWRVQYQVPLSPTCEPVPLEVSFRPAGFPAAAEPAP